MEPQAECVLALIGATREGKQELLLEANGQIARGGQIVDAMIVQVRKQLIAAMRTRTLARSEEPRCQSR
jgi:hypothetical protein